jgi:ankyrin repeat protein
MENWKNLSKSIDLSLEEAEKQKEIAKNFIFYSSINDKKNISKLLKSGANPNCFFDMVTPLMSCADNGHYDLAVFLLNAGASMSYSPVGKDALWHVLTNKKYDFLRLFVERKCLLNLNDGSNETPLIYAVKSSDLDAVKILLTHYLIKVNEKDNLGNTALHYNVIKNPMKSEDIEIGRLLIAAGADTASTNFDNKTPEELAIDFAAKSMIMAGKIEERLDDEDKKKEQNQDPSVPPPRQTRLKI